MALSNWSSRVLRLAAAAALWGMVELLLALLSGHPLRSGHSLIAAFLLLVAAPTLLLIRVQVLRSTRSKKDGRTRDGME